MRLTVKCAVFFFSLHVTVGSLQKGNYSSQSGMIPGSWQHKMKLQLILKSSKAYYVLSDAAMSLQKYGRALRYIKLALQSHGKPLYMNMFNRLWEGRTEKASESQWKFAPVSVVYLYFKMTLSNPVCVTFYFSFCSMV